MSISNFNTEAYVNSFFHVVEQEPLPEEVLEFFGVDTSVTKRSDYEQFVRDGLTDLTAMIFEKIQTAVAADVSGICFLRKERKQGVNPAREKNTLADKVSELFHKVYGIPLGITIQGKKDSLRAPNLYFISWSYQSAKTLQSLFGHSNSSPDNYRRLNEQRKEGKYTDISFQVEDKIYHAHKFVLTKTPFFAQLLESTPKKNDSREPITLQGIHSTTFAFFLEYLYTKTVFFQEQPAEQVMALAQLALLASLPELQRLCHLYLILSFSKDNSSVITEYAKCLKKEDPLHACCLTSQL